MSVPLTEEDVDVLKAFVAIHYPDERVHIDELAPDHKGIDLSYTTPEPPNLLQRLTGLGYRAEPRQYGARVLEREETPTSSPEHTQIRERLKRLREIHSLEDLELLHDAETTDDPRIARMRNRILRRKLRRQLLDRERLEREERRAEAAQRKRTKRDQARQEQARRRKARIEQQAQFRRERSQTRHAEWEHTKEISGARELIKRERARTPEYRAALLARMQLGVLVVAALSIISLGSSSTASVAKFMKTFASAEPWVAWGVEPAIIAMVVGVNIARYVLAQSGARLPWVVVLAEYGALGASVFMAGQGAGPGAVVAPIGVVVVTMVAAALIRTASRANPEAPLEDKSEPAVPGGTTRRPKLSSRSGHKAVSKAGRSVRRALSGGAQDRTGQSGPNKGRKKTGQLVPTQRPGQPVRGGTGQQDKTEGQAVLDSRDRTGQRDKKAGQDSGTSRSGQAVLGSRTGQQDNRDRTRGQAVRDETGQQDNAGQSRDKEALSRPGQQVEWIEDNPVLDIPEEVLDMLQHVAGVTEAVRVLAEQGAKREAIIDSLDKLYPDWKTNTIRRTANRYFKEHAQDN